MTAMLTTIDNPYDPFDDFDKWYNFDMQKGYNTCGYLARIANVSSKLSEEQAHLEIERAIDEICEFNVNGKYRKLVRE